MSYCNFSRSAYNKSMDTNETTPTTRTAVEIWMSFGFNREVAEILEAVHQASIVIPTEEETLRFFEER